MRYSSYFSALCLQMALGSAAPQIEPAEDFIPDADLYLNGSFGSYTASPEQTQITLTSSSSNEILPGDDCKGSAGCKWYSPFFHHTPSTDDCQDAYLKFQDYTYYSKQSCTYNHCAAIYECDNINYSPAIAIQGYFIKDEFNTIINKNNNSCSNCGSHYFGEPHGRCRVTLNYCNFWCSEIPQKCEPPAGVNGLQASNTTEGNKADFPAGTVFISSKEDWAAVAANTTYRGNGTSNAQQSPTYRPLITTNVATS